MQLLLFWGNLRVLPKNALLRSTKSSTIAVLSKSTYIHNVSPISCPVMFKIHFPSRVGSRALFRSKCPLIPTEKDMHFSPTSPSPVTQRQMSPFFVGNRTQAEGVQPSYPVSTDEWYRHSFEIMYVQLDGFVERCFSQFDDVPKDNNLSPWMEMSPEFCKYSVMVVEPDKGLGDWNRILLNRRERHYLLVGILARILEAKVFGELLFGGSRAQKKQLEELETSTVEIEGFARTQNRAYHVISILNGNIPNNLDLDVVRLSKQIMMLLQPVSQFLKSTIKFREGPPLSEDDLFRSIYTIVAAAAKLSFLIRISPTIIYFHSECPGNHFDPTEQTDMDYRAYAESKSAIVKDISETRRHRALVRFALWPSIKRYSVGTSDKPDKNAAGFRVYNISNSRVVYYWGLDDDEQRVPMNLQSFIEQQRRNRRGIVVNAANDAILTVGAVANQIMAQVGTFQVALILAVSTYLIVQDLRQGKDPFGWK